MTLLDLTAHRQWFQILGRPVKSFLRNLTRERQTFVGHSVPAMPTAAEWASLPAPNRDGDPTIDVVMPVFAGRAETLRAIHRVLSARNTRGFELVVVDDRTPDPVIGAKLRELAQRKLITLLVNDVNRGFVHSANRGMALHPARDVILLNADTEVFGDWIDRLRAAIYAADDVATATPWSNAVTILSYPAPPSDQQASLKCDPAVLDQVAAQLGPGMEEIPTAVGFCMYIRRCCLDEIGPLDEQNFGLGYGEENDFCMKAAKRGWRHVAALNVYVHHYDGRSFGREKHRRVRNAVRMLERLHPGYKSKIAAFMARDPLARHRMRLDQARSRHPASLSR